MKQGKEVHTPFVVPAFSYFRMVEELAPPTSFGREEEILSPLEGSEGIFSPL